MADKKSAVAGPRQQTYPITTGNTLDFFVQSSDKTDNNNKAFEALANDIKGAQHFVFVADWSFHPLCRVEPRGPTASVTETIGHLLLQATKVPNMLVAIHSWDHTGAKVPFLGPVAAFDPMNDNTDDVLDAIAAATGFPNKKRPPNLLWRLTSRLGTGFSIHQKFVVLDADGGSGKRIVKAYFGGLDLTKGRFDFHGSAISAPAPEFTPSVTAGKFTEDDWYNAEFADDVKMPRQGWQDFYASVIGPAAWDVLREFVGRWNAVSSSIVGPQGDAGDAERLKVRDKFLTLFDKSKNFVQPFEPHDGPFVARVVRSMHQEEWGPAFKTKVVADPSGRSVRTVKDFINTDTPTADGKTQREFEWKVTGPTEMSIQLSYLNSINLAKNFIYIETQYFIGSGRRWLNGRRDSVANQIPETILNKIVNKVEHNEKFHAYIVVPMFPEGNPITTVVPSQRMFMTNTMSFMAQGVARACAAQNDKDGGKRDWRDFLSFYFLSSWTNQAIPLVQNAKRAVRVQLNLRYQLYVHSKLMIVDDQYMVLGSANLNERSLAGSRDSELCLSIHSNPSRLKECVDKIRELRLKTWDRHLDGFTIPARDTPEDVSCSRAMRDAGLANWRDMAQGIRPPTNRSHLIHLPFVVTFGKDLLGNRTTAFSLEQVSRTAPLRTQDGFIFDAEATSAGPPDNGSTIDDIWAWDIQSIPFRQRAFLGAAE